MHVHVWILIPLQCSGALRKLVPDHSGVALLKPENELQLLACPVVLRRSEQSAGGNQPITREKPVVLRTPGITRRTVSSYLPAPQVGVADPRLIERDFGPRQRAIDERIRCL